MLLTTMSLLIAIPQTYPCPRPVINPGNGQPACAPILPPYPDPPRPGWIDPPK